MPTSLLVRSPLDRMLDERLIAVIRLDLPIELTLAIVESIVAGGITTIEVTLTTPRAPAVIERLAAREELVVGAGTVIEEAQLQEAIGAGARFYASPAIDPAMIERARTGGIVAMPGAYTPTEILAAWRAGADLVKIFPMPAEGARYIAALAGPLPHVRVAPSGGVSPETAGALLRAGAAALNVGTWLTHEPDGSVGTGAAIQERSRRLVEAVREAMK